MAKEPERKRVIWPSERIWGTEFVNNPSQDRIAKLDEAGQLQAFFAVRKAETLPREQARRLLKEMLTDLPAQEIERLWKAGWGE